MVIVSLGVLGDGEFAVGLYYSETEVKHVLILVIRPIRIMLFAGRLSRWFIRAAVRIRKKDSGLSLKARARLRHG